MKSRNQRRRGRPSERGLTLIEALVAITVFTIVFIAALMLYSVASSTYLRTDSAVIQQQNVRFAMDRMTETLRDAGAGHNMLGSKKVADEQIEGAWESAVFVRGDFDGERETDLESTTFPIVTTGNDEIVGYVLLKDGAGTIPISIKADFTSTDRDAIFTSNASIAGEETATINVAAITVAQQTNPPYQLAKVTFNSAGVAQYEIISENIQQLKFSYYPATGTTAVAVGNSGADSERDERATIRKIDVKLVGQTERMDMSSGSATGYGTFTLEQRVLAANLGIVGNKHNTIPPQTLPTPESITACNGHCRHHLIRWAAAEGVSVYRVEITAPAQGTLPAYLDTQDITGLEYRFSEPQADIDAGITRAWSFRVAAKSGSSVGSYTTAVSRTSSDNAQSVPLAPQNVVAVGASNEYAIDLTWTAVQYNVGAIVDTSACVSAGSVGGGSAPPAPWNIEAVDLTNSKIFRVRSTGSNTGADATTDVSTEQIGALKNAVSNTAFRDHTVAPCSGYFYRVQACDLCAKTSGLSDVMTTAVSFTPPSGVTPAKPPAAPTVVGAVGTNGTNYSVQLRWSPVTTASDGATAAVAHYVLERWRKLGAATTYTYETEFNFYDTLISHVDTPPEMVGTQTANYRYYVKAVYDCGSPRIGPLSDPYDLACTPPATNTVSISKPVYNDVFTRPGEAAVALELTTTGTGWTGASIVIKDQYGNIMHSASTTGAPLANKYTFANWAIDATSIPDGTYTASASATVGSCRAVAADTAFTIETTSCGQRIVNAAFQGNGSNTAESMTFQIENTCPNTVQFTKLNTTWTGVISTLRLIRFELGSTILYSNATGIASGGQITFTTVNLATGTILTPSVSGTFTFTFSDNFNALGDKDSATGKFTSITANIVNPTLTTEQLVDGLPIP